MTEAGFGQADVRVGSRADLPAPKSDFRYAPGNGHRATLRHVRLVPKAAVHNCVRPTTPGREIRLTLRSENATPLQEIAAFRDQFLIAGGSFREETQISNREYLQPVADPLRQAA